MRDSGDGEFLVDSAKYLVIDFAAETGIAKEPTAIALAFFLQTAGRVRDPREQSALEYLARGKRWETLGRTGDAFHSYFIGLDLTPDDPDLLLALAGIELRLELPVAAVGHAQRAIALCPASAPAAVMFARCWLGVLEAGIAIEGGGTRYDVYRFALTSAQRARVLDPYNDEAARILDELHPDGEVLGFFSFHRPV